YPVNDVGARERTLDRGDLHLFLRGEARRFANVGQAAGGAAGSEERNDHERTNNRLHLHRLNSWQIPQGHHGAATRTALEPSTSASRVRLVVDATTRTRSPLEPSPSARPSVLIVKPPERT